MLLQRNRQMDKKKQYCFLGYLFTRVSFFLMVVIGLVMTLPASAVPTIAQGGDDMHIQEEDKNRVSPEETKTEFDIPAQTLAKALIEFGEQANMSVLIQHQVRDVHTSGVTGRFVPVDALEILLEGTGLESNITDNGVVIFQPVAQITPRTHDQAADGDQRSPLLSRLFGALAGALVATAAPAEEIVDVPSAADDEYMEEIVVTATKREQSLSDVPVAVSAFTGDSLEELGVSRPADLMAFTPGLSGKNDNGTYTQYAIRGITSNILTIDAEASVGMFIDGMYIGRFGGAAALMFDVERVEVLKGPQSTMFGRNSSAGAISIVTNKPSTNGFEATASFRAGNHSSYGGDFSINAPVNEDLAIRFAGRIEESDGYGKYVLTGNDALDFDSNAFRFSLAYDPNERVAFDLSIDYEDSTVRNPGFPSNNDPAFDALIPTGPFDELIYSNIESQQDVDIWGVNGRFTVDLGNDYELQSLTAYRTFDWEEPTDLDGTPLSIFNFLYVTGNESYFQDLRLSRQVGKADWFVGLSYWKEDAPGDSIIEYNETHFFGPGTCGFLGAFFPNGCFDGLMHEEFLQDGETITYSAYGDLVYSITDKVNLSFGLRYSREEKTMIDQSIALRPAPGAALPTFAQALTGCANLIGGCAIGIARLEDEWSKTQPRLAIDYRINENHLIYASYGQGFKAGGFNLPFVGVTSGNFEEETSDSYEMGWKGTLFGGRARWNTALYYYDYEDYQDRVTLQGQTTPTIENAATVEGYGVETEFNMRIGETSNLMLTASWSSTEYDEYDDVIDMCGPPAPCPTTVSFSGNSLPFTPDLSVSVALKNAFRLGAGSLTSFLTYTYNDEVFFNRRNDDGEDSVSLVNLRLTYRPDGRNWSVGVYGENLADEEYLISRGTLLGIPQARVGYPRSYGIEVKFGL